MPGPAATNEPLSFKWFVSSLVLTGLIGTIGAFVVGVGAVSTETPYVGYLTAGTVAAGGFLFVAAWGVEYKNVRALTIGVVATGLSALAYLAMLVLLGLQAGDASTEADDDDPSWLTGQLVNQVGMAFSVAGFFVFALLTWRMLKVRTKIATTLVIPANYGRFIALPRLSSNLSADQADEHSYKPMNTMPVSLSKAPTSYTDDKAGGDEAEEAPDAPPPPASVVATLAAAAAEEEEKKKAEDEAAKLAAAKEAEADKAKPENTPPPQNFIGILAQPEEDVEPASSSSAPDATTPPDVPDEPMLRELDNSNTGGFGRDGGLSPLRLDEPAPAKDTTEAEEDKKPAAPAAPAEPVLREMDMSNTGGLGRDGGLSPLRPPSDDGKKKEEETAAPPVPQPPAASDEPVKREDDLSNAGPMPSADDSLAPMIPPYQMFYFKSTGPVVDPSKDLIPLETPPTEEEIKAAAEEEAKLRRRSRSSSSSSSKRRSRKEGGGPPGFYWSSSVALDDIDLDKIDADTVSKLEDKLQPVTREEVEQKLPHAKSAGDPVEMEESEKALNDASKTSDRKFYFMTRTATLKELHVPEGLVPEEGQTKNTGKAVTALLTKHDVARTAFGGRRSSMSSRGSKGSRSSKGSAKKAPPPLAKQESTFFWSSATKNVDDTSGLTRVLPK